jgi:hypothetical protein
MEKKRKPMCKALGGQARIVDHEWKVMSVPIERLKTWSKNPRHNDHAAKKLAELIKTHGFIDPIIATPDRVIRAGHTRYKAAQIVGLTHVPVIFVKFDSERAAELYSVSDNKASEFSHWDRAKLTEIFAALAAEDNGDLSNIARGSGFLEEELEGIKELDADDDDAARSFKDTASGLEKDASYPKNSKKEFWVWAVFLKEEDMNAVLEKTGTGEFGTRQMNARNLMEALGLKRKSAVSPR